MTECECDDGPTFLAWAGHPQGATSLEAEHVGNIPVQLCLECHPVLDEEPPVEEPPKVYGRFVCGRRKSSDSERCENRVGKPWESCGHHDGFPLYGGST